MALSLRTQDGENLYGLLIHAEPYQYESMRRQGSNFYNQRREGMRNIQKYFISSSIAMAASVMLMAVVHAGEKMVVAADVGFAPHVMAKPGGGV